MAVFNYSPEIRKELSEEFSKRKIDFRFLNESQVDASCSGNTFHHLVLSARCNYLTDFTGLLHVTRYQFTHYPKRVRVKKKKMGRRGCIIID